MENLESFIINTVNNKIIAGLGVFIILDTLLGSIRAIKERSFNSCFGINALLRKSAMVVSVVGLFLIDYVFNFDLINYVPEELKGLTDNIHIGLSELFSIVYMINELASIMKNLILCNVPLPKKFKDYVFKILENYTTELQNKKSN